MKRAMPSSLRYVLPAFLLLAACSNGSSSESKPLSNGGTETPTTPTTPAGSGSTTTTTTPSNDDVQRVISEADIVQIGGTNLYAISKTGTLSIIDVSKPNALTLLGKVLLSGSPLEMYLQPNGRVVVLLTDALGGGSTVMVLDAKDPTVIQRVGSASIPGTIFDSRLDGNLLYVVSSDTASTTVTSFDLSAQAPATQVGTLAVGGPSTSILFGNGRLYIGGSGGIELVDVSDTTGKIVDGSHIQTVGPITERWQMSEQDSVLRVVSQAFSQPVIETFMVWNNRTTQAMGNAVLTLPIVEPLKAVRFDTNRAYAITFRQEDPLFVIDLSNPTQPVPRGTLAMPGYLFYMEPHGNRLLGLGVDDTATDHLNVSLIDVTDMDHPALLQRVAFGGLEGDLPEDQNEIQKAFVANEDGLITVPYSGPVGSSCATGGGIQLIDWKQDVLTKQAFLPVAGNPRRALTDSAELVAVSDSNVTAFDISQHAVPSQTADLVVGTCELRTASTDAPAEMPADRTGYDDDGFTDGGDGLYECSATRVGGGNGTSTAGLIGLGLALAAIARRRAKLSID